MAQIKPSKHLGKPVSIPADPDSPNGLPIMIKAGDLLAMNMPLAKPVIHGLLSAGSTMVYGGASKTNKTYALIDMALSVASGKPWWGFKTEKGKVLYIDLEIQPEYYRSRLEDIRERKDPLMTKEDTDNLVLWNLRGKAKDISALMPEMEMKLAGQDFKMIVVDPIYKLLGSRDENSAGDINSLMNELDRLAVATGAAIVVGHHFSKGGQAGKDSMDRISGSGVFARSPDTIVIITRHEIEDVFTVNVTLRNFKPIQPFCVTWDFPVMVRTDKYDPAKLKRPGMKVETFTGDQLLKVLGTQELSTADWAKETMKVHDMSKRTFGVKKAALEDEGKITKTADGKWKASRIYAKDLPRTTNTSEVQQQPKHLCCIHQGVVDTDAAAVLS